MIIIKIQQSRTQVFLINRSVKHWIFLSQKALIQNFHTLNFDLLIKILNR